MSAHVGSGVCKRCARRTWLLDRLCGHLEREARRPERLWELLALPDEALIDALGAGEHEQLHDQHRSWRPQHDPIRGRGGSVERMICRHHCSYPSQLRLEPFAPYAVQVRGVAGGLSSMLGERLVTIVGNDRADEYGVDTARELASGLARHGVTVVAALGEGVARAAHAGALRAGGAPLAVTMGELGVRSLNDRGEIFDQIVERGGAISELTWDPQPRAWWAPARARTLALIADLTIVAQASDRDASLAVAQVCRAQSLPFAAVPGRIDSPSSRGSNALIATGASVVCSLQDALDLLYDASARRASRVRPRLPVREPAPFAPRELEQPLAGVLERVLNGADTLDALRAEEGQHTAGLELALTELELRGLLRRSLGGCYVPSAPPA